jgi:hypothetical protein
VSDDFRAVAANDWVDAVLMSVGAEDELSIELLVGAKRLEPTHVLSEASLDLLALLVLVEIHVHCAELGQRKLLVLDDVFQSVDSVHRVRALDHILSRLRGWQVIVTLHDKLWFELARASMSSRGFSFLQLEVVHGGFGRVPEVRGASVDPLADLRRCLSAGASAAAIAGASGRALEELCDRLSISLETSVTRRRGDRYTLGDLWPGISKRLLKVHDAPALAAAVGAVDSCLVMRNLVGAHYNEWAETLSTAEASDFAEATTALWRLTSCQACGAVLSRFRAGSGSKEFIALACKCA